MDTYCTKIASPIGLLYMASDGACLTGLWMEDQKYFASTLAPGFQEVEHESLPVFLETAQWLATYFEGHDPGITPPLSFTGSSFRRDVWALLQEIPYGQTTTYGALARALAERTGQRQSAQAVGGAVGHNPISVIVPCHRVVGADGSLTGYAGGVSRKWALLEAEGMDMTLFRMPTRGTAL